MRNRRAKFNIRHRLVCTIYWEGRNPSNQNGLLLLLHKDRRYARSHRRLPAASERWPASVCDWEWFYTCVSCCTWVNNWKIWAFAGSVKMIEVKFIWIILYQSGRTLNRLRMANLNGLSEYRRLHIAHWSALNSAYQSNEEAEAKASLIKPLLQ